MRHTRTHNQSIATQLEVQTDTSQCQRVYDTLHTAAWWGAADSVARLLATGVDCDARDHYGRTPLHDAASRGHLDIAALLLSHGADVNARDHFHGMTPLHWAAYGGDADMVVLLLTHGANPHLKDGDRHTAEYLARIQGHPQVLVMLRDKGLRRSRRE